MKNFVAFKVNKLHAITAHLSLSKKAFCVFEIEFSFLYVNGDQAPFLRKKQLWCHEENLHIVVLTQLVSVSFNLHFRRILH